MSADIDDLWQLQPKRATVSRDFASVGGGEIIKSECMMDRGNMYRQHNFLYSFNVMVSLGLFFTGSHWAIN